MNIGADAVMLPGSYGKFAPLFGLPKDKAALAENPVAGLPGTTIKDVTLFHSSSGVRYFSDTDHAHVAIVQGTAEVVPQVSDEEVRFVYV